MIYKFTLIDMNRQTTSLIYIHKCSMIINQTMIELDMPRIIFSSSSTGYELSLSARLITSGVGSLDNRSIRTP